MAPFYPMNRHENLDELLRYHNHFGLGEDRALEIARAIALATGQAIIPDRLYYDGLELKDSHRLLVKRFTQWVT